jgi:hypothetical protein
MPDEDFDNAMLKMDEAFKDFILNQFFVELHALKESPRFQIVVSHGIIELMVNALIEEKCKTGDKIVEQTRDFPHSIKLTILFELGLLDETWFELLNAFRKLRNSAAHGGNFKLTAEMLKPFHGLHIPHTPHAVKDPKEIAVICQGLIFGFWNIDPNFFFKYFAPARTSVHIVGR